MKTPTMKKTHNSNWRGRLTIASVRNETGAALIVALLLLLVLAILVPTAMNKLSQDFGRSASYTDSRDLFYLAEAGMEHGKARIKKMELNAILAGIDENPATLADNGLSFTITEPTPGVFVTTLVGTAFTWNGNVYNSVPFSGGTYYFRVYDNNDDGDQATDIDNLVYLESAGVDANGDAKTLRALVYKYNFPPDTFPAAVTLTGAGADLSAAGTMNISGGTGDGGTVGFGWDFNNVADTSCVGKEALAFEEGGPLVIKTTGPPTGCNGESQACIKMTGSGPIDNYTGYKHVAGTTPSHLVNATAFTAADADEMWTKFINPPGGGGTTADVTTTVNSSSSADWGSIDDPVVMHFTQDLSRSGNATGYGVLIVDGDLNLSGVLNWYGVILVGACSTCTGDIQGNGTIKVWGAMVGGGGDVGFAGTTDVRYSCDGIEVANGALGTSFNFASWTEVED